jgi:hypothetical protein
VSPSAAALGEFIELPGPPPELEARRQAFRAVMRRLLTGVNPEPDEPEQHEDDDAADAA